MLFGGVINAPNPGNISTQWFKNLIAQTGLEQSFNFILGLICCLAMIFHILYNAFGLTCLPLDKMNCSSLNGLKPNQKDLVNRLLHVQEQIRQRNEKELLHKTQKVQLVKLLEDEKVFKHRLNMMSQPINPHYTKPKNDYLIQTSNVRLKHILTIRME